MLSSCGDNICILPPVHANWGLAHVSIGENTFINFNATFVDDGGIFIGTGCLFGPNVTIVTAEHPISCGLRKAQLQYNKPVRIGNNVWIGAGATILAGVTIVAEAVVGAGALVNRDVEAATVVAEVPARPIRRITEADDLTFDHGDPYRRASASATCALNESGGALAGTRPAPHSPDWGWRLRKARWSSSFWSA